MHREERVRDLIQQKASKFLNENSNRSSLITVTKVDLSSDFKTAVIFVTVFPEGREEQVRDFLRRNRKSLKEFLKKETVLRRVPQVDFQIDGGEKSRQRIEEISQDIKEEE